MRNGVNSGHRTRTAGYQRPGYIATLVAIPLLRRPRDTKTLHDFIDAAFFGL